MSRNISYNDYKSFFNKRIDINTNDLNKIKNHINFPIKISSSSIKITNIVSIGNKTYNEFITINKSGNNYLIQKNNLIIKNKYYICNSICDLLNLISDFLKINRCDCDK